MIKVKLKLLIDSREALEALSQKEVNGLVSYKIGKILRLASNELELFNKVRQDLLNKYCIKDSNNQIIVNEQGNAQVLPQYIDIYNEEITKLTLTNIELNVVPLELNDFKDLTITPQNIMQIDWLIKKEEEA